VIGGGLQPSLWNSQLVKGMPSDPFSTEVAAAAAAAKADADNLCSIAAPLSPHEFGLGYAFDDRCLGYDCARCVPGLGFHCGSCSWKARC